jgi:hypothetical protein
MDALTTALEFIRARLNAALQAAEHRADDWVILSNIVGQDDVAFANTRGRIAMVLVNLAHGAVPSVGPSGGTHPAAPSPVRVEPLIAFVANFEGQHYTQGLTAISRTIGFFHQTPVFTPPGPGASIGPLTMQAVDLSLADVSCVMEMMGVKYLPSVFYQLRGVSLG